MTARPQLNIRRPCPVGLAQGGRRLGVPPIEIADHRNPRCLRRDQHELDRAGGERVRELSAARKPAAKNRRGAREEGMTVMRAAAVAGVLEGRTTLREINKVTCVE